MCLNIIKAWSLGVASGDQSGLVLSEFPCFVLFCCEYPLIRYGGSVSWRRHQAPCPHTIELVKLVSYCSLPVMPVRAGHGLFEAIMVGTGLWISVISCWVCC